MFYLSFTLQPEAVDGLDEWVQRVERVERLQELAVQRSQVAQGNFFHSALETVKTVAPQHLHLRRIKPLMSI